MPFVAGSFIRLWRTLFIMIFTLILLAIVMSGLVLVDSTTTFLPSQGQGSDSTPTPDRISNIIIRRTTTTPFALSVILGATIGGILFLLLATITILYIRLRREMSLFRTHMMSPDATSYIVNPSWVGNTSPRNIELPIELNVSSRTRLNENEQPMDVRQDS